MTVLIAEGEVAIQELSAVKLQAAGYLTLRAANAEQALTIKRQILPDLAQQEESV